MPETSKIIIIAFSTIYACSCNVAAGDKCLVSSENAEDTECADVVISNNTMTVSQTSSELYSTTEVSVGDDITSVLFNSNDHGTDLVVNGNSVEDLAVASPATTSISVTSNNLKTLSFSGGGEVSSLKTYSARIKHLEISSESLGSIHMFIDNQAEQTELLSYPDPSTVKINLDGQIYPPSENTLALISNITACTRCSSSSVGITVKRSDAASEDEWLSVLSDFPGTRAFVDDDAW